MFLLIKLSPDQGLRLTPLDNLPKHHLCLNYLIKHVRVMASAVNKFF